ncbi:hypothetical protein Tco_0591413 [Tanacetum coccineum]
MDRLGGIRGDNANADTIAHKHRVASTVAIAGQQLFIEGRRANRSNTYRGGSTILLMRRGRYGEVQITTTIANTVHIPTPTRLRKMAMYHQIEDHEGLKAPLVSSIIVLEESNLMN